MAELAHREPCTGSTPRIGEYVASHQTGKRLGRVESCDRAGCVVEGVWLPYSQIYPCGKQRRPHESLPF